jgi:selenocysteine-specific translation elongation factor
MLERYEILGEDIVSLCESLLHEDDRMGDREKPLSSGTGGAVPVDRHYNVKGVGIVVLGCVSRGMIKKHDTFRVLPTEKTAQIRLIQKHDDEADASYPGDRVELALKNIEAGHLDRRYVLSNDPIMKCSDSIAAKASLIKYWPVSVERRHGALYRALDAVHPLPRRKNQWRD